MLLFPPTGGLAEDSCESQRRRRWKATPFFFLPAGFFRAAHVLDLSARAHGSTRAWTETSPSARLCSATSSTPRRFPSIRNRPRRGPWPLQVLGLRSRHEFAAAHSATHEEGAAPRADLERHCHEAEHEQGYQYGFPVLRGTFRIPFSALRALFPIIMRKPKLCEEAQRQAHRGGARLAMAAV